MLIIAIGGLAKTTVNYISSAQASHGCSDAVTITVNTTWSTNQCHGDVVVRNGAILTINGGITADLSSLSVGSDSPAENGFITTLGDTLNGVGVTLNVDGNVYIRSGSTINGDGRGYAGGTSGSIDGKGPGGGTGGGGSGHGGGGAHGGNGGVGGGQGITSFPGGVAYDDIAAPDMLGSGGGYATGCCGNNGGAGGGAVKINAPSGTVTVDGNISMNGAAGGAGCCVYGGGGSGGSVWIITNTLSGSGNIYTNGGAPGGDSGTAAGSGAGGRIQLTFNSDMSSLTGSHTQALGSQATPVAAKRGGAGTVSTSSQLYIASNGAIANTNIASTPLTDSNYNYNNLTVRDYAYVTLADNSTLAGGTTLIQNNAVMELLGNGSVWTGGALTVGGDSTTNTINVIKTITTEPTFSSISIGTGTLQHSDHTTADTYHVVLKATGNVTVSGTINLDSRGYSGGTSGSMNGNGPGGGTGSTTAYGGGGAYGGNGGVGGGQGVAAAAAGTAYGSVLEPTDFGSGGGFSTACCGNVGGDGGGAVKLTSGATMTISGTITAKGGNGGAGCCVYGGGGAGGSIWLITDTLTGAGSLNVNGGVGGSDASRMGGPGAGGRIRITFNTDTSSLSGTSTQALGGHTTLSAVKRGGAGTVSTSSILYIANNGAIANTLIAETPLTDSSYSYNNFTIRDYAYVTLANNSSLSGGTTLIQNNSRITLLGNGSIWSGGALSTGGDSTIITVDIPVGITVKPLFSSISVNSGTLTHSAHTTTDTNHLILAATGNITVAGTIDVSGKGFSGGGSSANGNGPGAGTGSASSTSGGGGHGGAGGNGTSQGVGGGTYGSATFPVTLGSGGGSGANGVAGSGGGAVELYAGGTLAINSSIIASGTNGNAGCCSYLAAGGAGGSIMLAGSTISGSSALTANGGNGTGQFGVFSGCGGGGRIARHYSTSTYSGTVSVVKGSSGNCTTGQDGTNQTIGTVTDLVVTGISTPRTAGVTSSVVVEARDASNNRNYAYTKAITFTSTDSQATLPGNYTFTIADAGLATIPGVVLKTAGTQTVTADQTDDGTVDGTHANITVNAGSVTNFVVSGVTDPVAAGTSTSPTVTAKDAYTNTVSGYTGTVTFTSSDSQATLPANYTFIGGDAGVKTFTNGVVLKTAGEHTLTATNTVTSSITGTQSNITVNAATASSIVLSGVSSPTTAGAGHSPTATIKDTYNNTVTNYTGTIVFNSSDSQATLPTNYTFVGGDAGVKAFTNGVVLKTTGVHSITASDGTITGTIQNINVTAGQPTKLKVSNITSPIAANTPSSPTVTVQDQYNNTATGYTGTIAFSSSDAAATLPSNYAFSVSNQGVRTFTNGVTFATGGTHSLTAMDVSSPTINGTLSSIVVTAAASTGGTSQPGVTNQPSLTIVLIQPSEGTFFGTITQQVNGLPLEVTVTGTVKGNQINGTVSGTYNEQPVTGTITGTVKGQKIESAILTLFNANDPGFNLTVVVGGVISPPDNPKQEPDCKLRGMLELTIDGKKFSGEVQLTISPDGSVTGRAKGFLDNDRVFGTFSASSVEGRLIGGTVTLTSNNNNSPITGEIIGSVRDGEIQLTNAEHCNISTDVVIDTDEDGDADGEGTGNVEIDEPVSSSDIINGSIIGTVEGQTANEDVIVNGLFEALVSDVVIKPTELKFETNEQNDLISGALAVVSGLSVLPILPAVQSILLTSSTRGFTFIHWFFFGYTPRKRRKFWGVIKDKTTGVPVAGVLVKLVDVHNDRVINQYRTDKTGRYGFLVETVGDYRITIIDPLYAAFSSEEFSVDSLKQPIVTGDIQLTPVHQRQLQLLNKTFIWVAAIKVLNIIHWPLLIGGTILSVMLVADHPTTLRTLIASLYSVLWLSKLFGYRRERHYGQVTDGDGAPLARAVVQLTNQSGETTAHVHSTVTDAKGRFVLLVKPGVYTVIVAKDGYKTRQGAVIADEANMTIRLERAEA